MRSEAYFSQPILTAWETARYLGMPESTLDVWLVDRGREPLVHAVRPEKRGWPRVPFVGVIEAYVLRALRDFGLPMEDIRKAAELVREEFDDPYALAHRRIVTDGVALFVKAADDSFLHARDRQLAIPQILEGPSEEHRVERRGQRHSTSPARLPPGRRRHHRPPIRVGLTSAGRVEGQGRGPGRALAPG